jgi:hypothetical protein
MSKNVKKETTSDDEIARLDADDYLLKEWGFTESNCHNCGIHNSKISVRTTTVARFVILFHTTALICQKSLLNAGFADAVRYEPRQRSLCDTVSYNNSHFVKNLF